MASKVFRGNILNTLVPISRFNKGEANKVFDEVRLSGYKIVVKNNAPACILLAPESYQEMLDIIDDQYLLALANERLKNDIGTAYSFDEILAKDGLSITDVDAMEDVEIEL
ncbi:MAG: type II toxin-antitoxin system Phd/YefM family antitoxin [Defluviitaleaceae bacterium]|nr:type II toxin-antitoxin system Phd/YefM family antitoxin [Defluviitaleaceae bacterium]